MVGWPLLHVWSNGQPYRALVFLQSTLGTKFWHEKVNTNTCVTNYCMPTDRLSFTHNILFFIIYYAQYMFLMHVLTVWNIMHVKPLYPRKLLAVSPFFFAMVWGM